MLDVKKSFVWDYFKLGDYDNRIATCKLWTAGAGTTAKANLITHYKAQHSKEYSEFVEAKLKAA